ncbi:hypothetical protein ETH_00009240 [Eimeria tenella]|uniref:Uncharacterized protein n=1 Tax=Eimeria tenella TaxID=5802 RepID=U6L574_EIMTE|nr:hypothetical protein ETH_00009240 [Eimeria tenella]CDJ42905.1 hypothetical protein ETH_00009240 [Eimeria tenella]|eukprot:XP_013233655.1 hypothetical protein ETH_00009240 [Eimeria tenella]
MPSTHSRHELDAPSFYEISRIMLWRHQDSIHTVRGAINVVQKTRQWRGARLLIGDSTPENHLSGDGLTRKQKQHRSFVS